MDGYAAILQLKNLMILIDTWLKMCQHDCVMCDIDGQAHHPQFMLRVCDESNQRALGNITVQTVRMVVCGRHVSCQLNLGFVRPASCHRRRLIHDTDWTCDEKVPP